MDNLLEIGQIVNSYGIKGFLKVVPFTDNVKRFDDLKTIYIEKNKKETKTKTKTKKTCLILVED